MKNFRLIAAMATALASLPALAIDPAGVSKEGQVVYLAPAPWTHPITQQYMEKAVVATPALDTYSRVTVRNAYNTYYNLSMPAVGWTGSVAGCVPGNISLAFQEWTISRINFLRAMAGVPGNTTLDSSQNTNEQAAALIMQANSTLTHAPTSGMTCYSAAGAQGAGSSNLAYGTPSVGDSIPIYMSEPGSSNAVVGHRRWILHSGQQQFGLGQTTTASALWVFDGTGSASVPNGIPWPPRGFVPLTLFPTAFTSTQRWSFGLPNANFGTSGVTVLLNGSPVAVNIVSRTDNGYGDNTIVWEMPANHTVTKGTIYQVDITGVGGVATPNYRYLVRPFDTADAIIAPRRTDLNGDSRADMGWRNAATGEVYRHLMNGTTITNGATAYGDPNTTWKIVGDGDFNGDGISDLLYRNQVTGQVSLVTFGASGVAVNAGVIYTEPNLLWKIVATPDLDGDGKADILWWNSATGQVYAMLMSSGAVIAQGMVYTEPNTAWKIVAVGDFAGSGKQNQLLWRNDSTGQVFQQTVSYTGNFAQSGQIIYTEPNTAWKIVGTGDLNGDTRTDILWRNDSTGQVYGMLMNGAAISSAAVFYTEPSAAWKIVTQGDYNGDGRSDLLWRNDITGQVYMMLMNGLSISSAAMVYTEPNPAWHVLGPPEYAQ